jgi:predicted DCC family thiol-disulfide oxidoreductase YuxK
MQSMESYPRILLFDGVCNLCNSTVRFIIKRDPQARFKFTSLQSDQGQLLLKQFRLPADQFDFIIYIREGECLIKSTAILQILKDLGGRWKLLYGFTIIPEFIRDFLYTIIAKRRYHLFGRQEKCMVPTPDIKQRFLE